MEKDKRIEQFHNAKERYQILYKEVNEIKAFVDSNDLHSIRNVQDKQKVLDRLEILFKEAYHDSLLEEIHNYLLGGALIYVDDVKQKRFDGLDLSNVLGRILNGINAGLEREENKELVYKLKKVFMQHAKDTDKNFFEECAKHASEIASIILTLVF